MSLIITDTRFSIKLVQSFCKQKPLDKIHPFTGCLRAYFSENHVFTVFLLQIRIPNFVKSNQKHNI